MIKVLVADDHAVVREGIKRLLSEAHNITVAGEAGDGAELLARVAEQQYDVVLMDLAMPGPSGLDTLEELRARAPRLPVLILSMYPEDQYAVRTLMAGASGYINKGSPPERLVEAIRMVAAGRRYISEGVAQLLASHVDNLSDRSAHETLSKREFQVMCLIASGQTVGEIADDLSLSVKTVSTYRTRVLEKLGLRHNAEIIRYALKHDLVE